MEGIDAVTVITDAAVGLLPGLLAVGAAAIGVSGGVLLLRKGWGFFTKNVKA